MPTIRFKRAYVVKDASGTEYAAGQEVEVSEASAEHFVRRGAAEIVPDAKPAEDLAPLETQAVRRKRVNN